MYKITFELKETDENGRELRWKNSKEILINHKGTRMLEEGEDFLKHGLQTMALKY